MIEQVITLNIGKPEPKPAKKYHWQRPKLYPKQESAFFAPERLVCIEHATKSGGSHGGIVWLFEQAMLAGAGQEVWWVSPAIKQAKIAFDRIRNSISSELYQANSSELFIKLFNDATIRVVAADNPDSLYGVNVHAAFLDHPARMKEEAWDAVRSTMTESVGPIRAAGSIKGTDNWFYKLCRKVESGKIPNAAYHRITARDAVGAGILSQDEFDYGKTMLDEETFKQLYLAEAAE